MDVVEPRSHLQMMADMLQMVVDSQWSDQTNTACHCHPEYAACCPECEEMEYQHDLVPTSHGFTRALNDHKPGCRRKLLIVEVRTYLEVENGLAEERGEETVYVP